MATDRPVEVTVTLADDVVERIKSIDETGRKLAQTGILLESLLASFREMHLTTTDVAGILGARAGTSKRAVMALFAYLRKVGDGAISADEIISHHLAARAGLRIGDARAFLGALRSLTKDVKPASEADETGEEPT